MGAASRIRRSDYSRTSTNRRARGRSGGGKEGGGDTGPSGYRIVTAVREKGGRGEYLPIVTGSGARVRAGLVVGIAGSGEREGREGEVEGSTGPRGGSAEGRSIPEVEEEGRGRKKPAWRRRVPRATVLPLTVSYQR